MLAINGVGLQDKVDFVKNLTVMLKAGITLNEALGSLAAYAPSRTLRGVLTALRAEVEKGVSLSEACGRHPHVFDPLTRGLIRAGEASGTLEEHLAFLADWLEHRHGLEKEIQAALLYPKIVFSATLLLGGWLAVFILPKLVPFFRELRVALPLSTRTLLATALFAERFWPFLLAGVVLLWAAWKLLNRVKGIRRLTHQAALRMPIFGQLFVAYHLALLSYLFTTLLKSGLPLAETLKVVSQSSTNMSYQASIDHARVRIASGTPLGRALSEYPKLYPPSFLTILAVGEKSGTLERSFEYLAEFHMREVQTQTKRLPVVIEPLLLLLIGLAVAFIALSIISPIYDLIRALQNVNV